MRLEETYNMPEQRETHMSDRKPRAPYTKPAIKKHDNLKEMTFECPDWQCSVTVPPPPPNPNP